MARIAAIGTAVPPFVVSQAEAKAAAEHHFGDKLADAAKYLSVFDNAGVQCRYFCVPIAWFQDRHDLGERNDTYLECAEKLCTEAVLDCLRRAKKSSDDIGHIVFVSSSGIATPSLEVRLINKLGFRPTVRRTPVFGLGCAGGAAGLAQSGLLAAVPEVGDVMLVAVELNSLTFQFSDYSPRNLVACSLFSDGAAAVLVSGDDEADSGPKIVRSRSKLWPGTVREMGWDFRDSGFKVVFSKRIPSLIVENMAATIDDLMKPTGIAFSDVEHHVFHPGGAKVLAAYERALPVDREDLVHSYQVLEQYGNMSSPTMLFVLKRFLEDSVEPGSYGLCAAFGPGFAAELLLIRW